MRHLGDDTGIQQARTSIGDCAYPATMAEHAPPRFELLRFEEEKQSRLNAERRRLGHDMDEDAYNAAVDAACERIRAHHEERFLRMADAINHLFTACAQSLYSMRTAMALIRTEESGRMGQGLNELFHAAGRTMEECCRLEGVRYDAPSTVSQAGFDTAAHPWKQHASEQ